ncbi:MAG: ExeM/NucH family extracellular endonuclease [Chryseolinea sp.]
MRLHDAASPAACPRAGPVQTHLRNPGQRRHQPAGQPERHDRRRRDPPRQHRLLHAVAGGRRQPGDLGRHLRLHRHGAHRGRQPVGAPERHSDRVLHRRRHRHRDHQPDRHHRQPGLQHHPHAHQPAGRRRPGALRGHAGHAGRSADRGPELLPGPLRPGDAVGRRPAGDAHQQYRPGSAQALALAADNAARMVVLEDGSSLQNVDPTPFTGPNGALRGGDTVAAITGVIDYGPTTAETSGPGAYRILPLDNTTLQYTISNPRTATPPSVGGNVKLASFNVLNYFTTFKDGRNVAGANGQTCVSGESASSSCRGANNAEEFARQQAKIVAAIGALDADAVGLMEIQNNAVAAQNLVAALNTSVGAGTYAVAPGPAAGVVGSDAIKTTIIYKPAKLGAVGDSVVDNASINNRPTVAQTFALANGLRFTLAVNHLKSKGSCPSSSSDVDADQGDGQGCYNATRVAQANQLRTFVAQRQTSSGSNDVVLVGDFNAYGMENPITALTDNGYVRPDRPLQRLRLLLCVRRRRRPPGPRHHHLLGLGQGQRGRALAHQRRRIAGARLQPGVQEAGLRDLRRGPVPEPHVPLVRPRPRRDGAEPVQQLHHGDQHHGVGHGG